MNSADAEHILAPIWIGFAVAEARLEALLADSRSQPMDRETARARLRHEQDLEDARAYLQTKARGLRGFGLRDALNTGRTVITWPNVFPHEEAWERTTRAWQEARAAKVKPLEVRA
jgi:hypothetical protein